MVRRPVPQEREAKKKELAHLALLQQRKEETQALFEAQEAEVQRKAAEGAERKRQRQRRSDRAG